MTDYPTTWSGRTECDLLQPTGPRARSTGLVEVDSKSSRPVDETLSNPRRPPPLGVPSIDTRVPSDSHGSYLMIPCDFTPDLNSDTDISFHPFSSRPSENVSFCVYLDDQVLVVISLVSQTGTRPTIPCGRREFPPKVSNVNCFVEVEYIIS